MKKIIITLMCLMVVLVAIGQSDRLDLIADVEEVEVTPPSFTGIENTASIFNERDPDFLTNYLSKRIIYPENALNEFKEGIEIVQFIVNPTGELSNFRVINSVCPEIDEEVIYALQKTEGMWKPGLNNGIAVPMEKEVSLVFNIENHGSLDLNRKFMHKAKAYYNSGSKQLFLKQNLQKALRKFDIAMRYLPYDECLLYLRGLVKYELDDKESARHDWDRIKLLAEKGMIERNIDFLAENYKEFEGFQELQQYMSK